MSKDLRIGLQQGGGPPPGYLWSVWFLSMAEEEGRDLLNDEQHAHAVDLLRALAAEEHPTRAKTVSVDQVEDFYELRDKGGVLRRINLRIFFAVEAESRVIVVLAVVKKEADGQTPTWMKLRVRQRLRRLRAGEFGEVP